MDMDPLYLRTEEAAIVAGLPSAQALRRFVRRWNREHPNAPIRWIRGRVERASLLSALSTEADLFTSTLRPQRLAPKTRRAAASPHMSGTTGCNQEPVEDPNQLDLLSAEPIEADDTTD